MIIASECNSTEAVRVLLNHTAGVNVMDEHRRGAIHYAAENSNCEIIKMLVDNGAYINYRDEEGMDAYDLCDSREARAALTGKSEGWLSWLCRI